MPDEQEVRDIRARDQEHEGDRRLHQQQGDPQALACPVAFGRQGRDDVLVGRWIHATEPLSDASELGPARLTGPVHRAKRKSAMCLALGQEHKP